MWSPTTYRGILFKRQAAEDMKEVRDRHPAIRQLNINYDSRPIWLGARRQLSFEYFRSLVPSAIPLSAGDVERA